MNERELGRALLRIGAAERAEAPTLQQLTGAILRRDRRWVQLLTAVAVLFWLLAVGGVVLLMVIYLKDIDPRLGAYFSGRRAFQQDAELWLVLGRGFAQLLLGCAATLLLAALATVLLIMASRRATLRQINVSLLEISEQLKQLRQGQAG